MCESVSGFSRVEDAQPKLDLSIAVNWANQSGRGGPDHLFRVCANGQPSRIRGQTRPARTSAARDFPRNSLAATAALTCPTFAFRIIHACIGSIGPNFRSTPRRRKTKDGIPSPSTNGRHALCVPGHRYSQLIVFVTSSQESTKSTTAISPAAPSVPNAKENRPTCMMRNSWAAFSVYLSCANCNALSAAANDEDAELTATKVAPS